MKKKKSIIILLIILIILGLAYLGANLFIDSLINKTQIEEEPVKKEDVQHTVVKNFPEIY